MTGLLTLALLVAVPAGDIGRGVTLEGMVLARSAQRSVALLASHGRARAVVVGESAFGGRLLGVSADGALLDFGGQQVILRLSAGAGVVTPPATPLPAAEESPAEEAAPPVQHKMMRADVDRRLGLEMNRILAETALKPVLDDGQVVGVAITRLARDSLLTDVGLQAGDVIKEINGTEIDGLSTLMGLYARLQTEKDLRAVVLRGGRPVTIELKLQ